MLIDNLCVFRLFSNDGNFFYYADGDGGNYIGTTILDLVDDAVREGQAIVYLTQSPMVSGMAMGAVITPRTYKECIDDWTTFRLTGVLEERHPRLSTFAQQWTRRDFAEKHHHLHVCEFENMGFIIPSLRGLKDGAEVVNVRSGVHGDYLYQAKGDSREYFVYNTANDPVTYYRQRYPALFDGIYGTGDKVTNTAAYVKVMLGDQDVNASIEVAMETGNIYDVSLESVYGFNKIPRGSNVNFVLPTISELVTYGVTEVLKREGLYVDPKNADW